MPVRLRARDPDKGAAWRFPGSRFSNSSALAETTTRHSRRTRSCPESPRRPRRQARALAARGGFQRLLFGPEEVPGAQEAVLDLGDLPEVALELDAAACAGALG